MKLKSLLTITLITLFSTSIGCQDSPAIDTVENSTIPLSQPPNLRPLGSYSVDLGQPSFLSHYLNNKRTDDRDEPDDPVKEPPGMSCVCDEDCMNIDEFQGICVFGVCMLRASDECPEPGSREVCPEGSRCWEVYEYGGFVCYPDCDSYECEGDCHRNGSCIDTEDTDHGADPDCSSYSSDDSGRW